MHCLPLFLPFFLSVSCCICYNYPSSQTFEWINWVVEDEKLPHSAALCMHLKLPADQLIQPLYAPFYFEVLLCAHSHRSSGQHKETQRKSEKWRKRREVTCMSLAEKCSLLQPLHTYHQARLHYNSEWAFIENRKRDSSAPSPLIVSVVFVDEAAASVVETVPILSSRNFTVFIFSLASGCFSCYAFFKPCCLLCRRRWKRWREKVSASSWDCDFHPLNRWIIRWSSVQRLSETLFFNSIEFNIERGDMASLVKSSWAGRKSRPVKSISFLVSPSPWPFTHLHRVNWICFVRNVLRLF